MKKVTTNVDRRRPHRSSGFTLVELLVVVGLVLLMMSMFAQIFVMATDTLSQQRGIAENDQRGRLLSMTLRGDLDHRTFRDVLPFRANEDTRQLGHSLARRSGYFEIDEGTSSSGEDDVLQFTASVNISLHASNSAPFVGRSGILSGQTIQTLTSDSITLSGDYQSVISTSSPVWIGGSTSTAGYSNNGRYFPTAVSVNNSGNNKVTTIKFQSNSFNTSAQDTSVGAIAPWGVLYLSESDPDFDDGIFGNFATISSTAEISYFLRNGNLYRRVLLIRDTANGGDAQPTWSNGTPILWGAATASTENYGSVNTANSSTFWRDFDFSAFYFGGVNTSNGVIMKGIRLHDTRDSMSNSSQPAVMLVDETKNPVTLFPISLGIPHLRFGHSTRTGFPQDMVNIPTRFTLQECSNSAFGYPGNIDGGNNPFDTTNLSLNSSTALSDPGLVTAFSGQTFRRGEDILMTNVLTFDVKVLDPNSGSFVNLGDDNAPLGRGMSKPTFGRTSVGRLNTTYGPNDHFRFDTWHPLASVGTGVNDNEPPYIPFSFSSGKAVPLSAIQITINYRDPSSNQVRQMTIVQSLVDRLKPASVTNEAPEE